MDREKFCLRWNDFESNISKAFQELRDDKDFFDVTLACEDEQVQAHKVILAACSPFFRNILRRNQHQHPLLYMKGVKFTDLQAVLNFMYHGEVNVAQEELNSFLAVAEDLRVKGLTQNQTSSDKQSSSSRQDTIYNQRKSPTLVPKAQLKQPDRNPPQPSTKISTAPADLEDDDIQEVVPIKSEPLPAGPLPSHHVPAQPPLHSTAHQHAATEQAVTSYQEEALHYEDYGDYQDQGYNEVDTTVDHALQAQDNAKVCSANPGVKSPDDLYQFCSKPDGETKWKCNICWQFSHRGRNNVRNHVESKHFPNQFEYHCDYCEKTCHTKKGLEVHTSEKHRYNTSSKKINCL